MTNTTKSTKKNTTGCDCILDAAFVPQSGQNTRAKGQQNALRQDAGAAVNLSLADLFDKGFKVEADRRGTPEEGMHMVTLRGEPEVKNGYDGPYVRMELRNEIGICWTTSFSAADFSKILTDISYHNKGMLAGKRPAAAIAFLYNHSFSVWTLQTEKGKTATYFNEERFSRRLFAIQNNKANAKPEAPAPKLEKAPWEE